MTAHRIVLSMAAIAALGIAAFFGAMRIAGATQSMFAVAAFGFASGFILGLAGEAVGRRAVEARLVDDGFFDNAVKRYPLLHFLLGAIAIVGLALYFVSTLDTADYDQVFRGSLLLGITTFLFVLAVSRFGSEQFDD